MKVVVGLGNPGLKYRDTRHNLGFRVLAVLAQRHSGSKPKVRFESEVSEIRLAGDSVQLVAPQTYMNNSGRAVGQVLKFYQLELDDLLIVCDDLNLDTGRLRMRPSGSAGGQNGLKDIINRLGSESFARLRIGIGSPPERMQGADYVLSRFRKDELETVDVAVQRAADGVERWIEQGLDAAMNYINAPQD